MAHAKEWHGEISLFSEINKGATNTRRTSA